jgi:glycosyltransferase involved in cell wall biosynthesis
MPEIVPSVSSPVRPPLSVTIITLNEERKLPRALASVAWAEEVLVVDSGSTDRTIELARQAGARVVFNAWKGYGQQKNFAQDLASHDWVLNIDADEEVSPALRAELEGTLARVRSGQESAKGFSLPRKTFYLGRWIMHGGWYPNRLVRLADRQAARWTEPEVHEEWRVRGPVGRIKEPLRHYTFDGIRDQVLANVDFARLGASALRHRGTRASVGRLLLKPIGKFVETYFWKRGFLDGIAGFIISVNAAHSMFLKYAYLIESERFAGGARDSAAGRAARAVETEAGE